MDHHIKCYMWFLLNTLQKDARFQNDTWFSALRIVVVHSQGFYHMCRDMGGTDV